MQLSWKKKANSLHIKLFRSSSCAKVGARTKKLEGGGGKKSKIFSPLSNQAKKQTDSKLLTTSLKIKTLTVSPRSPRFPGAPAVPSWPCISQNDNYIKKKTSKSLEPQQVQQMTVLPLVHWRFKAQEPQITIGHRTIGYDVQAKFKGVYQGCLVPLFAKELDKSETFNSKKEETGAFVSYCRYSEVHFCQESSL